MSGREPASGTPYTVLARRFRPQTFEEVVGQQQIGQSLRNAIRSGRVAHAYLFTGARGVGKTSTARILAKALNCPNATDAIPCNQCEVCRSITAGSDVDVLEIDGASNRGIDDIRTLRSNVNVRSMRSPYKVYIIDEVHMLTKEAFNALLKTLEEPPPNVKFVFCTTEPNKVPDTILSRCQRFDFGFIAAEDIEKRLAEIASRDGIEVDPDAVSLVARRAGGSMRDSQSLFDQLLAFGGERISVDDVHRLLGTAPDDRLFDLFEAILSKDRSRVLELLDRSLTEGVQIGSFAEQLLSFLRDLMIAETGADAVPLLSVGPVQRTRLKELVKNWGLRSVTAAMQILTECRGRMQRATYGRALVELALVRLTMLEELESLDELATRISAPGVASSTVSRAAQTSSQPEAGSRPEAKKNFANSREEIPQSLRKEHKDEIPHPQQSQTAEPAPSVTSRMKFDEHSLEEAWPQLLAQLPEAMSGHLSKSTKCAIFGPNTLEIVFGPSYFLSKAYCERSEALKRLQSASVQVFGNPIHFQFRIENEPTKNETKPELRRSYDRRPTADAQSDEYVQQVLAIFGGSVVELRELPSLPGAAVAESNPE
jgi:DNA polymerase-3 subunit gamma/tau